LFALTMRRASAAVYAISAHVACADAQLLMFAIWRSSDA